MPAFTDQEHDQVHSRAFEVERLVEEEYGLCDAGDLYYSLVLHGQISMDASIDDAVRMTAQQMQQA